MITVKPHRTELLGLHASVGGLAVFLDLFAIKELAKGDPARRKRFIALLDRGVEVLFSVSNAAELSGPQGPSSEKMREFLDEIGPHWFPVEFDPQVCIQRELELKDPLACCVSERLLKAFTATGIRRSPAIQVADLPASLPADFFRLGLFMDSLASQRQAIIDTKAQMGRMFKDQIMEHRSKHEKDPAWLDDNFPEVRFKAGYAATFAHVNLVRLLILEFKDRAMMPNDAIDFGQAVIASAYASVATLDKHWKRRVDLLPKPNGLARVYCSPYLDQMVQDIEKHLDWLALQRGRVIATSTGTHPPLR